MNGLKKSYSKKDSLLKREKKLPLFAREIAIITSPDGAALQDFISILKRRGWTGKIWVVPSLVQGNDAPKQLVEGITQALKIPGIELLVLARGGVHRRFMGLLMMKRL